MHFNFTFGCSIVELRYVRSNLGTILLFMSEHPTFV
jgi:hypothetical protein